MNVETTKFERWKIALICHTLLVTITFVHILYYWKSSTGESSYTWALIAILDIPAAIIFTFLDYVLGSVGVSGTIRYTILAYVVFLVAGGAQWFLIFYRRKPRPETECKECGYDLRASMEFGRCPECGTPIKTKESSIQSDM